MTIKLEILAADPTELHRQILGLAGFSASPAGEMYPPLSANAPAPVAEPEARKASRTRKEEAPAQKAEDPTTAPTAEEPASSTPEPGGNAPASASPEPSKVPDPEVPYTAVQDAVKRLAAINKRDAILSVFKEFGVDHASKLQTTQYAAAVEALTAHLED